MSDIRTLFRWHNDPDGGEHGTATYFPGTTNECTVTMPTFKQAHQLQQCIESQMKEARWSGRRELLNEIARIKP